MTFAAFLFLRSKSINAANTQEEGIIQEPLLYTEMWRSLGPYESLPTMWFSLTGLDWGL